MCDRKALKFNNLTFKQMSTHMSHKLRYTRLINISSCYKYTLITLVVFTSQNISSRRISGGAYTSLL